MPTCRIASKTKRQHSQYHWFEKPNLYLLYNFYLFLKYWVFQNENDGNQELDQCSEDSKWQSKNLPSLAPFLIVTIKIWDFLLILKTEPKHLSFSLFYLRLSRHNYMICMMHIGILIYLFKTTKKSKFCLTNNKVWY